MCLVLITDLLRASVLTGAEVGIVAIYSGQVKIYVRALAELNTQNPGCGYADGRVGTVERWITRTAEVVIFDMAGLGIDRTSKGQYLAQRVRLQIALTSHCHGLAIIGSIHYCYENVRSLREITDKICQDQVLLWLINVSRLATVRLPPYSIPSTIGARPPILSSEETKRTAQERRRPSNPSKKQVTFHPNSKQHDGPINDTVQEIEASSIPSKKRVHVNQRCK